MSKTNIYKNQTKNVDMYNIYLKELCVEIDELYKNMMKYHLALFHSFEDTVVEDYYADAKLDPLRKMSICVYTHKKILKRMGLGPDDVDMCKMKY